MLFKESSMDFYNNDLATIISQTKPKKNIKLNNTDIDIYLFNVKCFNSSVFFPLLSKDEIIKAEKFSFQIHRNRSIIARGILRVILSSYIGIHPSKIKFSYNKNNKPFIASEQNFKENQFNVSHSGDYLIIGICDKYNIGVDIEMRIAIDDMEDIVQRYTKNGENQIILDCDDPDFKLDLFYSWWTRTEAILKAEGAGIAEISNYNIKAVKYLKSFTEKDYIYSVCLI